MRVWNRRTEKTPKGAVYVGRPSKWGNPYPVSMGREYCIARYADWLDEQLATGRLDITELKGRDLICWCTPLPCHADVLLKRANPLRESSMQDIMELGI